MKAVHRILRLEEERRRRRDEGLKEIWRILTTAEFDALFRTARKLEGKTIRLKDDVWVRTNLSEFEIAATRKYFDLAIERRLV